MFGTMRKHSTAMWVVIIFVVVVSFVFWGSQTGRYGNDVRRGDYGTIGGERLTVEKFNATAREVYLKYFANTGEWPGKDAKNSGFDPDRETFYRLFLLSKAKEFNLRVKNSVVAQTANNILGGANLAAFESQILTPQGFTAADFERYVRNEVIIQELASLLGASGLMVTPEDARATYTREHQEFSVQTVAFLAVGQLPQVTVSTQTVAQFYTNQLARYRLPERVQVSYVAFAISNHLVEAEAELVRTNFTEIIEANYKRLGTNYFKDAKTPEEAKAKVRENVIRQQAALLAEKDAKDFSNALAAGEPKVENLQTLAKDKGLTVGLTEPFNREDGPKDLSVGPGFIQAAFRLTSEEPFTRPVRGNDAIYVLAFNRRLPSELPSFESIQAQVTTDCRYEQAVALAHAAGAAFIGTLTNGLAQGKTFSELCIAAKLKPVLLPPVSLSTRSLPEIEQDMPLGQFKQVLLGTPVGKVSPLLPTRDGGVLIYVRSTLPLDEEKMKTDLPAFTAYLRQVRMNDAFNEWFRHHAEDGLRNTAYVQLQAEARGGTAPAAKKKR